MISRPSYSHGILWHFEPILWHKLLKREWKVPATTDVHALKCWLLFWVLPAMSVDISNTHLFYHLTLSPNVKIHCMGPDAPNQHLSASDSEGWLLRCLVSPEETIADSQIPVWEENASLRIFRLLLWQSCVHHSCYYSCVLLGIWKRKWQSHRWRRGKTMLNGWMKVTDCTQPKNRLVLIVQDTQQQLGPQVAPNWDGSRLRHDVSGPQES